MEFDNNIPIYLQIIDQLKTDIATGNLKPGEKLPSTRQLALEFNVNPNTASRVYREMERDEMVYTKRGMGTYVTETEDIVKTLKNELASKLIDQFMTGMNKLGFNKDETIEVLSKHLGGEVK